MDETKTNPFEAHLAALRGSSVPEVYQASAVHVHDTLLTAKAVARSLFGDAVAPDVVMAVYDRLNAERLRRVRERPGVNTDE
jgi:hypothetical protein